MNQICPFDMWKDIVGYEGIYEVSAIGEVRTKEGKTTESALHGKRVWRQRILKQKTDKYGYKRVTLWKNKKSKGFLVHRLVALSFIEQIERKPFINHKDGNTANNNINNLEWCNSKENVNHAFDNHLIKTCHSVFLINKKTKEKHYFRSKSRASLFLGKKPTYIANLVLSGITETEGFTIHVK